MNLSLLFLSIGLLGGQISTVSLFGLHTSFLDIAVIILLVTTALQQKKRFIPPHWAPFLGFTGATLLSIVLHAQEVPIQWSVMGTLYAIRFMIYAAICWVASSETFKKNQLVVPLIVSGVGIALLGLLQFFLYPDLRNLYLS